MGKLYFYYGAMGSAKSAQALMLKFNYEQAGKKVLLLKPSIDTRSQKVSSRIGLEADCTVISLDDNPYDCLKGSVRYDIIIVDEAQFLREKQVDQLRSLVDRFHLDCFCYGLRTNFRKRMFAASARLMEVADTITEIKSVCRICGKRKAIFNIRLVGGKYAESGPEVLCGDTEYIPCCSACEAKMRREAQNSKEVK